MQNVTRGLMKSFVWCNWNTCNSEACGARLTHWVKAWLESVWEWLLRRWSCWSKSQMQAGGAVRTSKVRQSNKNKQPNSSVLLHHWHTDLRNVWGRQHSVAHVSRAVGRGEHSARRQVGEVRLDLWQMCGWHDETLGGLTGGHHLSCWRQGFGYNLCTKKKI